jgi:hypothetical protein
MQGLVSVASNIAIAIATAAAGARPSGLPSLVR